MGDEIINKVAESGLITIDPEQFYPAEAVRVFDIQPFLFMGMVLKEKEFRAALQANDWTPYKGETVAVYCSADAIIPVWAYMLAAVYLLPIAKEIFLSSSDEATEQLIKRNIEALDVSPYQGQRIVIKGCGEKPIGDFVYFELTKKLWPVAKSIMYGEPCSTVPVFKKK